MASTAWRINITAPTTAGQTALVYRMTLHETNQGADIAQEGGTTFAASTTNPGNTASLAFDLDATTFWSASNNTYPQTLAATFTRDVTDLWGITLTVAQGAESNGPKSFDVQKNQDGAGWVTVWSVSNAGTYLGNIAKTFENPNSAQYGSAPPAPTYYRLRQLVKPAGGFVKIGTLTFHASSAGANLATGGTPFALSSFSGLPPSNAFDGSAATIWHTNVNQDIAYLGYQFASAVPYLYKVTVTAGTGEQASAPTNFVIESSANNITYVQTFAVPASGAWSSAETKTFTNPNGSVIYSQATTAVVGVATSIVVEVQANGTVDTTFTGNITASKKSGPGNLTGTLVKAAQAGRATFADLGFDTPGAYIVSFTPADSARPAVDSSTITVTAPASSGPNRMSIALGLSL